MGNKLTVFLVIAILFLIGVNSLAFAREITVANNDSRANFRSIRETVNDSSPGDKIIVMSRIYKENIIVNVTSLTIMSESKNY